MSDPYFDNTDREDGFYEHSKRQAINRNREFFDEHHAEHWQADPQVADAGFLMWCAEHEPKDMTITVSSSELLALAELRVINHQADESACSEALKNLEMS